MFVCAREREREREGDDQSMITLVKAIPREYSSSLLAHPMPTLASEL